jgi:hypothetical protein
MRTFMKFQRAISVVAVCGALLAAAASAQAEQRGGDRRSGPREQRMDSRYNHNRSYPERGFSTSRLPPSAFVAHYGGRPYYFDRGVWYRPYRGFYTVIAPPFGIVLPVLPPFYTTVWFRGIPYYYANDTYYLWSEAERGYVVTAPPQNPDSAVTEPPVPDQLFIYPKNGQSEAQQSTDRYECHAWARQQSGYDPTEAQGGVDSSQVAAKRSQYQRAEQACLESRGYTVR